MTKGSSTKVQTTFMRYTQMTTFVIPQIIYYNLHSPEFYHFFSSEFDNHSPWSQTILHHLQYLQLMNVQSFPVYSSESNFL